MSNLNPKPFLNLQSLRNPIIYEVQLPIKHMNFKITNYSTYDHTQSIAQHIYNQLNHSKHTLNRTMLCSSTYNGIIVTQIVCYLCREREREKETYGSMRVTSAKNWRVLARREPATPPPIMTNLLFCPSNSWPSICDQFLFSDQLCYYWLIATIIFVDIF